MDGSENIYIKLILIWQETKEPAKRLYVKILKLCFADQYDKKITCFTVRLGGAREVEQGGG